MKISTSLISGAGNTFHIVWKSPISDLKSQQHIAQKICKLNSADGFIFLNSINNTYTWGFYNNDGSVAEMCGNATRCVGYFVKNILQASSDDFQLQTIAGPIQIKTLTPEKFQVQMTRIIEFKNHSHFYCDTGVPHIVIQINDFENYRNYLSFCRDLRFHSEFLPRGTNVTLISATVNPHTMKAVSYERGVEDFTAACGTGAAAAAFYNLKKNGHSQSTVQMPGGDLFFNLKNVDEPMMVGPAILLGEYTYDIEI